MSSGGDDILLEAIEERTARGIAAGVNRLITSGALAAGTRLPTVRQLAKALSVSPTTVSEAWQSLAAVGAVEGRGRRGTFVAEPTGPGAPTRYRRVTEGPGHFTFDLSTGTPAAALLPDLSAVVARLGERAITNSYLDPAVLPAFEAQLRSTWPFPAEAITVVDGAMDALDRIAQQTVHLGDRVVVEDPTFPPLLDLLDHLGAEVIGVPMDAEGMTVDGLRSALRSEPVAVFCQLRAHNPTGITTSARRAKALAALLAETETFIVEDDHSADIATGALVSIGRWIPQRTVHVRSFSKSHGPDLRLAAIGGAESLVRGVANRRLLGAGWTSRLLQAVLLRMLTDADIVASVDAARATYSARRQAVCAVLAARGVTYTGDDGINLWVEVRDERAAMLALAARGIGVAPGEPFMVGDAGEHRANSSDWLRVTIAQIPGDAADDIAAILADAAALSPTWR